MSAVPNRAPKSGFAAEAQRKVSDFKMVYRCISRHLFFLNKIKHVITFLKNVPKVQKSIKTMLIPRRYPIEQTMLDCD